MKRNILITIFLIICFQGLTQLRLPAILNNGMVLQQNDSVWLWGWGYNLQDVSITTSWNNLTTKTKVTNHGRWQTKIKTPPAGGPYTIVLKSNGIEITLSDILSGEVWACSGQSNMEWNYFNNPKTVKDELPLCNNSQIRFFQVPRTSSQWPQDDLKGNWTVCDSNTLKPFSAVGYYFGKKIQHQLNVPVGLINVSWGGTPTEVWTPAEEIYNNSMLRLSAEKLKEVPWCPITPGVLYNGMINPIGKFKLAGVIWYQGEGNTINYETYADGFATMINSWRKLWNQELPFYYVQIAPFKYGRPFEGAMVREAQAKSTALPNTAMIVIPDLIDSVTNIHPGNKKDVGYRLANYALAKTYSQNMGADRSPVFDNMVTEENKLIISVNHIYSHLQLKGAIISGFSISGDNQQWLPATGYLKDDKIVLWNAALSAPKQVRYCFDNTTIGNVYNLEGLPLEPFRTDSWPVDSH